MDCIFNNWKYQILPTEDAIEEDDIKPQKPTKNNHNQALSKKNKFTEDYCIEYRNGILLFYSFESLELLKERCDMMNYNAIIYIIKNNDNYKSAKDNIKKIMKKITDISNNEEVTRINIECSIIQNEISIQYRINNNDYRINGHQMRERKNIELNEYIEELKGNLVILDIYIRKKLQNEYPELFIEKNLCRLYNGNNNNYGSNF